MTDREAARILPYLIDRCHSEAEKAAIRKAEKTLQEREELSKGCEYCMDADPNKIIARILSTQTTVTYTKALLLIPILAYALDIDFCPECGRRLKGENNG